MESDTGVTKSDQWLVRNEFACIEVSLDTRGNSPLLCLRNTNSGEVRLLDPVQLEAILWLSDELLTKLCDPAQHWTEAGTTTSPLGKLA